MNRKDPFARIPPAEGANPFLDELYQLQVPVVRLQEQMREYQSILAGGEEGRKRLLGEKVNKSRKDLIGQILELVRDMEAYKKRKQNPTRLFDLPWELRRQIYFYLLPPYIRLEKPLSRAFYSLLFPFTYSLNSLLLPHYHCPVSAAFEKCMAQAEKLEIVTAGRMLFVSKQMNEDVLSILYGENYFIVTLEGLKGDIGLSARSNALRIRNLHLNLSFAQGFARRRRRNLATHASKFAKTGDSFMVPVASSE
ncbi:hypothetical protein HYFRA_00010796 [Hymenoscyphus fraxineus]|uniref:F-box domain-containing protein n=1 Tax=Hymenoscyphus fraxineus TaxID=746836 RepID=A0A9N9KZK9_9HELO|nr:hypothetical protein HYFRA_00010796 [Hymenoscyphus fraxineus]